MTTNHPAHGPVLLDRLHQIRETLSNAAAQSDGGNLGYAMADAVKVIDVAIAEFGAEPVAYTEKCEITNMQATGLYLRGFPDNSQGRDIALYSAPPTPMVHDDLLSMAASAIEDLLEHTDPRTSYYSGVWSDVPGKLRAAMLQGNHRDLSHPVDPQVAAYEKIMQQAVHDGWVAVPVEPTEEMLDEFDSIIDYGAEDSKDAWSRLIAAAPQQEVKLALEHGMQRYASAMQKLSEGDK